jgi:uncharacterized protein DUF4129
MSGTRVELRARRREGARRSGGRIGLLALAALLLVAGVGLGSSRSLWRVEGPPGLADPDSYLGDVILVGFALLVGVPLLVSAIRSKRRRAFARTDPDLPPPRFPWWVRPLAIAIGALVIFGALQLLRLLPASSRDVKGVGGRLPSPQAELPDGSDVGPPPVHWWGIALVMLLVLAGAVTAWRLREQRAVPDEQPELADELLDVVDLSLDDLEHEPDPRRAVIRAYGRMERVLGAHGLARRPAETPLEYLARALTSLRLGRASVERLTALFERAKFSQHEIDGAMKADAIFALGALRDELAAVAP